MTKGFRLDHVKYGVPFHKFTNWELSRVVAHKEGMEFLRSLMKTLESMEKLRPALVELHDELKTIPGI